MSDDKKSSPQNRASLESEFDVFKRDGSTRLPHQRFADSAFETSKKTGPVQHRILTDLREAPEALRNALQTTELQGSAPPPNDPDGNEALTIRLETYRVDLAERIARVKSEQKDALDGLQQLEDESKDENTDEHKNEYRDPGQG